MADKSSQWAKALDQIQICDVRRAWAFSLDLGRVGQAALCFHPDARITVSWYSGPLDGFIARSRAMAATRKPEEHRKHWLGNMRSGIRGARAVLETDVLILIREFLDGTLFDYTSYAQFYDLFENARASGASLNGTASTTKIGWIRSSLRDAGSVEAQAVLAGPESGFAFMQLRQSKRGRTIRPRW